MKYIRHILLVTIMILIAAPAYSQFGEPPVARLREYKNKVQMKPEDGVVWKDVKKNMNLYENDRIRTMDKSLAVASYNHNSNIVVKENSLVVIKKMITNEKLKRADIELTDGSVTGRVKGNPEDDVVMIISARPANETAKIEIDSRQIPDKSSEVDVGIQPNKDIHVHVKAGKARVTSKGKTIELNNNESTIIKPDSAPLPPWVGKKRPFSKVLLICIVFLSIFAMVSIIIVVINKRKVS